MVGLLKPKEVADILKVSVATLHRLAGAGKIPSVWIGGQRRFHTDDVSAVLENGTLRGRMRGRPRGGGTAI